MDLGKFSSVSVPLQIPMIITMANHYLIGLILGSLAIFTQVFSVIESHPGCESVKEDIVLRTTVLPVVALVPSGNLQEDVRSQPK